MIHCVVRGRGVSPFDILEHYKKYFTNLNIIKYIVERKKVPEEKRELEFGC